MGKVPSFRLPSRWIYGSSRVLGYVAERSEAKVYRKMYRQFWCANLLHTPLFRSGWRNNARLSGLATLCANLKTTLPPATTAASLLNTRETSRRSARKSSALHG